MHALRFCLVKMAGVAAGAAAALWAAPALAQPSGIGGPGGQDLARVISSVPVIQQVAVPRQVCTTQQVVVPGQRSGAGAAMGAIAGGAIGNSIGEGGGRAAATLLGLVGGAMLGDRIEGPSTSSVQNVQQCSTQTFYENRTIGYNVVYEYAGRQYQVQLPQDPGPTVRIQITPISELPAAVPVAETAIAYSQAIAPVSAATYHAAAPQVVTTTTYVPAGSYAVASSAWSSYVPAVIVGSALYWGARSWSHRPHVYHAPHPVPHHPPHFVHRPHHPHHPHHGHGAHRPHGARHGWR